ncbi:hypothetical protein NBRC116594_25340 [Shimia sp. NS0008-38b]|uniref:winged helix-turn-helix domain-containing tetratricopeptide repeat protein n=1 Tax=Shimia sp. NS0008-38b TaxID=3127653 RepID=UPI00310557BA
MDAEKKQNAQIIIGETFYVPESGQLFEKNGAPIHLRAQSFTVLRYLAKRLGILVTRDELVSHVWRDLAVTDDSLTQCISDLRRAIGDTDRKVLKTLPKRGFVLNGQIVPATNPAVISDDVSAHVEQTNRDVVAYIRHWERIVSSEFQTEAVSVPGLAPQSPPPFVKQVLFKDVSEAAITCRRWARKHGAAIALSTPDGPYGDILATARPGEVLASFDVHGLAQQHPALSFEDLGYVDGQTESRAFRLLHQEVEQTVEPLFLDQPMLPTVAVLPLHNIHTNEPEVLGTVFADLVSSKLGAAEEINVISRLSTAAFARGTSNLADIGRFLKAEFVLSGFFIRHDNNLQLNLEFAETKTQHVLWSYRLEVSVAELVGDFEAAQELVAKIRHAILINEIRSANIMPLGSLQNYSLMLGAVGLMHRLSPHEFTKARKLLDTLTDRAPNHPVPLAWTARWHLLRVVQGWSEDPDKDAQAALGCTGRALDMDPENVLALACEGHILTNLLHRFDDAEDRYNLALEMNPSDANARALRGMLLAFQERGDEGVRDTERALRLSPLDPHRFFYLAMAAGAWLTPGDFEKVEQYARASLRLNRTHLSTLRMLAVAQQKAGKHLAARETVSDLMRLQPGLRVSAWLRSSPSAEFKTGRLFAQALREAGVPD